MRTRCLPVKNVDVYLSGFPPAVRAQLGRIRTTARRAAPGATEAIKYGLPTLVLLGKNLVHFGAFARHFTHPFHPLDSWRAVVLKRRT